MSPGDGGPVLTPSEVGRSLLAHGDAAFLRAEPRGQRLIHYGIGAFLLTSLLFMTMVTLMGGVVGNEPGFAISPVAEPSPDGTFVVTLDTSDRARWVSFDFDSGRVLSDPGRADLIVRRYWLRAPGGVVDLGEVPLDRASVGPDPEWVADVPVDGVPQNPALAGWYAYSYWTHLLESQGRTYALRRIPEGIAYVRIESYYCAPEGTGCLTIRYRLDD